MIANPDCTSESPVELLKNKDAWLKSTPIESVFRGLLHRNQYFKKLQRGF